MNFIELLQFSLGISNEVPDTTDTDWEHLFAVAKKQSLTGVLFHGIEKLPKDQTPPKQILLKWYMLAEKIKQGNQILNEQAVKIVGQYTTDGLVISIYG